MTRSKKLIRFIDGELLLFERSLWHYKQVLKCIILGHDRHVYKNDQSNMEIIACSRCGNWDHQLKQKRY
jgi:hypothetical protein